MSFLGSGNRYAVIPQVGTEADNFRACAANIVAEGGRHARFYTPENLCGNCGHARNSHLDQPEVKGDPPSSDRGWCCRPVGSCIYNPCHCLSFVEPGPDPSIDVSYLSLVGLDEA